VIRSVLTLKAAAGQGAALEEFYAEHGILDRSRRFPGCRDALLLRSTGSGSATHLVIADWDSEADYRNWVADPWRDAVSRQIVTMLDTSGGEPLVGGVFELVETEAPVRRAPLPSEAGNPSSPPEEHQ
jgi:heme-degrading monooxygenase HmoA